jgi:hypothetical protein
MPACTDDSRITKQRRADPWIQLNAGLEQDIVQIGERRARLAEECASALCEGVASHVALEQLLSGSISQRAPALAQPSGRLDHTAHRAGQRIEIASLNSAPSVDEHT